MTFPFITVQTWVNKLQSYVNAGELLLNEEVANGEVSFKYDKEYLRAGHDPLDPKNLPTTLDAGLYICHEGNGTLPAYFQQFVVSDLMNKLLFHAVPQWKSLSQFHKLQLLTQYVGDFNAIQLNSQLEQHNIPLQTPTELQEMASFMRKVSTGQALQMPVEPHLLAMSHCPGRRGKMDYADVTSGQRYVVRFRTSSLIDDTRTQIAYGDLESNSGIENVALELKSLDHDTEVLFQENYKQTYFQNNGDPRLLKFNTVPFWVLHEYSTQDHRKLNYADAVTIINQFSCAPDEDRHQLMLRALFSASINHTANGLNDLALMNLGGNQWRLAPAVNTIPNPDISAEFDLAFGDYQSSRLFFDVDETFTIQLASIFGMSNEVAIQMLQQVNDALTQRYSQYQRYNIPPQTIVLLEQVFSTTAQRHGILERAPSESSRHRPRF